MTPHIMQSPMTGNWYVVTRYRPIKGAKPGIFHAIKKYDVTDQMKAILRKNRRPTSRRRSTS